MQASNSQVNMLLSHQNLTSLSCSSKCREPIWTGRAPSLFPSSNWTIPRGKYDFWFWTGWNLNRIRGFDSFLARLIVSKPKISLSHIFRHLRLLLFLWDLTHQKYYRRENDPNQRNQSLQNMTKPSIQISNEADIQIKYEPANQIKSVAVEDLKI